MSLSTTPSSAARAPTLGYYGIPRVALLAFAGPGAWDATVHTKVYQNEHTSFDALDADARSYTPNVDAVQRLNVKYGLSLQAWFSRGQIYPQPSTMIVTTTKKLSANERTEITEAEVGCAIHYVGPLLDAAGAPRAGVLNKGPDKTCQSTSAETNDVLSRLQEASRVGRQVVLASMGTVTTGNHRTLGWNGRPIDTLGNQYGLTGAQMARAVWGGLFDAVGTTGAGPCVPNGRGPV